jgi:ubiquinone/menaquinone biosynthesis C-methylase UbiE
MSILDVGCGPGSISVDMAKLVPKGRVVGVDCTPEPLNDARAFAIQQGVTNIEFQVGDIHALDFQTTLLILFMSTKSCSMWRILFKRCVS